MLTKLSGNSNVSFTMLEKTKENYEVYYSIYKTMHLVTTTTTTAPLTTMIKTMRIFQSTVGIRNRRLRNTIQ